MTKMSGPDTADRNSPQDEAYDHTREPTRFAWIYDGLLVAGTLADWVWLWEADYYAGDCPPPVDVLTWDGSKQGAQYHRVEVTKGDVTEDDYIPYSFTVPGLHDVASVSIDGRN